MLVPYVGENSYFGITEPSNTLTPLKSSGSKSAPILQLSMSDCTSSFDAFIVGLEVCPLFKSVVSPSTQC